MTADPSEDLIHSVESASLLIRREFVAVGLQVRCGRRMGCGRRIGGRRIGGRRIGGRRIAGAIRTASLVATVGSTRSWAVRVNPHSQHHLCACGHFYEAPLNRNIM